MGEVFINEWQFTYLMGAILASTGIFGCLGFALWEALTRPERSPFWHITSGVILLGTLLVGIFITRIEVPTIALYFSIGILSIGLIGTILGTALIVAHRIKLYRE